HQSAHPLPQPQRASSRSAKTDARPQRLGRQSDRGSGRPTRRPDRTAQTPMKLTADEQGKLTLHRAGEPEARDVRLRRAFPWSHRDSFISIRSAEGNELALIEDLATLDPQSRQLITDHLTQAVFIPRIKHIDAIDVRFGYQQWSVQTDRGPAQFRVQERED